MACRLWGRTELDTTKATQQQQEQHFLPFLELFFHLVLSFLCCAKPFKFIFVFISITLGGGSEDLPLIYVIECSAYVFL